MKWLDGHRIKLALVGCVAAVVLGDGSAKADFIFGEPMNLGPAVNSLVGEVCPSISPDGLELYFHATDLPGGYGNGDLWVSRRATKDDPWETPTNLGPVVNSPSYEYNPVISPDGLSLYLQSNRPGGYGSSDIWVSVRTTASGPWSEPINLGPEVNSAATEMGVALSLDGLELYLTASGRAGGQGDSDLWTATRATREDEWSTPVALPIPLNTAQYDGQPALSSDGLLLLFTSRREGGLGRSDIWMSTRSTIGDAWSMPVNLGPTTNTPDGDAAPGISADGKTLYFHSNRSGGFGSQDIYSVPIIPIVDFNGDEVVDSSDMCVMVDHWGESYSLCDIGPLPWGDGVVDIQDLVVLAEHIGGYRRPVAHWALDENEGSIAHDKIAGNNASVYGSANWLPAEGRFGGTLVFDGVDGWAFTGPVSQLSSGSFSIVAWVKGWAPNRVIISQAMGSNWLVVDAEGNLTTEIECLGRSNGPLLTQTIITGGTWHQIALVWDGSHRSLYVDGALVAEDTQTGLDISNTGLNFGVGKDYVPETYWSGMIDDVRIYDVALSTEQIAALAQ